VAAPPPAPATPPPTFDRVQRADLAGPRQERRGLGADQQVVVRLAEGQPVVRLELAHLPHRHLVGHAGEDAQRFEIVETDQLDDRAGVQVVAHDHGGLVREQGVDRRHPAPQGRVVDRVVVHQRGQVDQLDRGGQRHRAGVPPAGRLVAEQQDRGPEELALGAQQVGADLGDAREVGGDDAVQLVGHARQLGLDGALDVAQRGGGGGAHARSATSRARARPRP